MRIIRYLVLLVLLVPMAWANQSVSAFCTEGNQPVTTSGIVSLTKVMISYPQCTVTVYNHGTVTLATIFSDNNVSPTPLANPFTASANGSWEWYAANGRYDVVMSGAGFLAPFTIADILLYDPPANGMYIVQPTSYPTIASAVAAAQVANACAYIPPGTYTESEIVFTGSKKPCLIGAGSDLVTIIPAASNQRLFRCQNYLAVNASRCDNAYIGGFTIKAHASGSTGEAFNLSGFRFGYFFDIGLQTNGTGSFTDWLKLNSANLCYKNVLDRVSMSAQSNVSGSVVSFKGNGVNANENANANTVLNPWIYGNTGTFTAIDATESSTTQLIGGLIESNGSAVGIKPGTDMTMSGTWVEANGTCMAPTTTASGASNRNTFIGVQFSGGCTVNIAGYIGWNSLNSNGLTLTNASNASNVQSGQAFNLGLTLPNAQLMIFTHKTVAGDGVIFSNTSDQLEIIGLANGGQIANNAASATLMSWNDTGTFLFPFKVGIGLPSSPDDEFGIASANANTYMDFYTGGVTRHLVLGTEPGLGNAMSVYDAAVGLVTPLFKVKSTGDVQTTSGAFDGFTGFKTNGVAGITGDVVASGTCTFHVSGGIITSKTGC